MLDYTHYLPLVAASLAISVMSSFAGLALTRGASGLSLPQRKLVVAMSAIVLGGGIWAMHFVAMLGLRLPVAFYYDGLPTLISALAAILMTGIALLIVHFGPRTPGRITAAGVVLGLGIPVMHYLGMAGMQICRPVYSVAGVAAMLAASLTLCIASVWLSYGGRSKRNLVFGTIGFGLAVFAVHFIAMAGTGFVLRDGPATTGGLGIGNETLAVYVALASFAIAGAFLLTGVTFGPEPAPAAAAPAERVEAAPVDTAGRARIPFEQNGQLHFIPMEQVAAIRAEGRYTFLHTADARLFSPWSIGKAAERLEGPTFLRCHRSHLVNVGFVVGLGRMKDKGVCRLAGVFGLTEVPVSRSNLRGLRDRLGV